MQPTLQPLNRISSYTLVWTKPSWRKYNYELHDGDAVVATVAFNSWKSTALCEISTGEIAIHRQGFWQPRFIVSAPGGTEPLATYRGHWTGKRGTLTFAEGAIWQMHMQGAWRRTAIWTDPAGREIVRATTNARNQTTVTLDPAAMIVPETALVLVLTQYLTIMAILAASSAA